MSAAPPSVADPFDAGPYARLQAALNRRRLWSARAPYRAVALTAIAWAPLVVLAAVQGLAWNDRPQDSLLLDPSVYARYLVTLPVLVLAEPVCLLPLAMIARYFPEAGLIAEADRPRYDSLLLSARSLLEHRGAEIVLVLLAYFAAVASAGSQYPTSESSWVAPIIGGERHLSLAGWWRLLVSQPLLLVLWGAWLWRIVIWARFLWQVSRLDLRLVPVHPDLAGGLGFVATSVQAFSPIAFALGASAAGGIAEGVLLEGRALEAYRWAPAVLLLLVFLLFVAPMLVFCMPLIQARIRGSFAYGELAEALGRRFEQRWLGRGPDLDEDALGVQDFSATTDLYSIAANVRNMQLVPFGLRGLIPLLASTLLPFVPLVFAVIPFKQLLLFAKKLIL
ncbi:MAG TPA: hypothetical protein VFJ81_03105 [Gemmatimonadales bacterium]|nr:hypothetical protein [Gemmatimonadales bacterium]